MYISKETIEEIDINDFSPGKIVEQLKFFPEIFEFLKSKEKEMGRIRPLITFLTGVAIWAFRKSTPFKETMIFYQNELSAMGLPPLEPPKIKNNKNKLTENQKEALIDQSFLKRKIPSNFFYTLWERFKNNRDSAKSIGDMVEALEPELWRYFLTTIKSETMRNKDISKEEIGTGALVFSLVTMGLLFTFGDEHTLEKLRNIVENKT